MLRELGPSAHARDAVAHKLAIPRLIEEKDLGPRACEGLRDHDVVLAEGIEGELLHEARLVLGGPGRVVSPARVLGPEIADRLEMNGLRVGQDPLFPRPGPGDVPPAPGAPRGA